MRIAIVSPLEMRVPPVGYGGTELVVSLLGDELARRGHEVTLFASGDSQTAARLDAVFPYFLRGSSRNVSAKSAQCCELPEAGGSFRYHPQSHAD